MSPDLPAIPRNNSLASNSHPSPLSSIHPTRSQSASSSPNPDYSPSLVEVNGPRPVSTASTGRKWFSFGRSPSIPQTQTAPSVASTESTVSPNPSFSTPPLPSAPTLVQNGTGSDQTTPSLSLSPYLNTPVASSSSSSSQGVSVSVESAGLNVPMERNNSGSSFVTARSESWFGFGGGSNGSKGKENEVSEEPEEIVGVKDQDSVEEIKTPIRSEFTKGETAIKRVSPVPPEKEASPRRPLSTAHSTRTQDPHRDSRFDLRPPSPSPSQMTTTSTISSSNKDLPATVASPPLPPLPPATPSASALSTPSLEQFETDPTRLPFSSSTSSAAPNTRSPTARTRTGAIPRPLAIHVTSSLPSSSSSIQSPSASSFLTCPSPAPSSAATTPTSASFVGGPSQGEMTAGSRSPRSPNEVRWKEAVGSLDPTAKRSRSRTRSGQSGGKENLSRSREHSGEPSYAPHVKKEVLPPSPPPPPARIQNLEGVPNGRKPLPPTKPFIAPSLPAKPPSIINGLRIDTTTTSSFSVTSSPSLSSPGQQSSITPRPTDKGPKSAQPLSLNPSSRPNLFRHHSSSSHQNVKSGLTPSSSLQSISSMRSDSSTGHSSNNSESQAFMRDRGRSLSPDGTKAVEDLDRLMESMMAMMEGNDEEGGGMGNRQS